MKITQSTTVNIRISDEQDINKCEAVHNAVKISHRDIYMKGINEAIKNLNIIVKQD